MNTVTEESPTSQHHHQHHHHNHHHHRHATSAPFSDTTFHYGGTTDFLNYTFDDVTDDVDNFNYINKHFITPALFYSITLVGITGNSLVIYVILSNQKMRTVINLLLFNLAIADLSFVAVVPPSTSYYLAMEHWPFGNVACKTMHYLVNVTAYITVYTLVLISVIRFLTVVRGLNTTAWRTKRIVMASVVGMWLLMLLLNMPIFFKYHVRTTDLGIMECDYDDEEAGKGIFTTFFVFAYLLPLACIGMLSVGILRHIEKNKPTCGPMLANHRKTRSGIKKRQASRLLILVVVMFAVSWLPIQFHLLLGAHFGVPDSNLYAIIHCLFCLLAYSNSCVNPIIYNHTSRDFREAFRAAVARCCHCCLPLRKPCAKDNTTFSMAETIPTMSKRRDIKMSKIGNGDEEKKMIGGGDGGGGGGGGGGLSVLVETMGEVMVKNDDDGCDDGGGAIDGGDFGDLEGVEYNPGGKIEMKIEAECNNIQRVSDDNDGDDVIVASVIDVNVE